MVSTLPAAWRRAAAVSLVMCAAAGLRFWGITSGAPFRMSADEPVVLGTALRMVRSGDFNPYFYDYGGLTLYLQMAVTTVRFLAGALQREWVSLDEVWEGDFLVSARLVTAALGTLTVWLVYRVGTRWGGSVALIAAAAMAVQPQHVRESHYALTDTPLTLFVVLALLLSLRAVETGGSRAFLLAGLAVGAAAATKYNGGLALVMPIAASLSLPRPGLMVHAAGIAAAGAAAGFLVASPYTILDLPGFLNGFAVLMQSYNQPRPPLEAAVTYFKYLRNGFSWPGVLPLAIGWIALGVCALGGLVAAGQTRTRATRWYALVLIGFPVFYLWLLASQSSLQYGRYLLPVLPMLSVGLALGLAQLRAWLPSSGTPARVTAAVLPFLLLAPPLSSVVASNVALGRTGTAEQAGRWLLDNLAAGDHVVVELAAVRLPPRFQAEVSMQLIERSMGDYQALGVDYLVATSAASNRYSLEAPPRRDELLSAFSVLMRSGQIVATFPPSRSHPGDTVTIIRVPEP